MPATTDLRFERLRTLGYTGGRPEMMLQFYQAGGATSNDINLARDEWLDGKGFDTWYDYLDSLGHTGTVSDMQNQYWASGPSP